MAPVDSLLDAEGDPEGRHHRRIRSLCRKDPPFWPLAVTLIDRRHHHVFQPLLYQVATAGLSAIEVGEPIRRILRRQANISVHLGEVVSVDLESRRVALADDAYLDYDYLIVATGARDSYFGHDGWEPQPPD